MRVLLVDDCLSGAGAMAEFFRLSGHAVEVAANGEAALCYLGGNGFDVVLTDYWMPALDGEQLVGRLRHLEDAAGRPRTPVVFLTAAPATTVLELEARCARLGPLRFLQKPVSPPAVLDVILGAVAP